MTALYLKTFQEEWKGVKMNKFKELLFLSNIDRVGKGKINKNYLDIVKESKNYTDLISNNLITSDFSKDKIVKACAKTEKMYEEILMDEEGLQETPNKLIHIGKPIKISKTFMEDLDELIKAAYKNKDDIKDKVAKIVTTYTVDKERVGK